MEQRNTFRNDSMRDLSVRQCVNDHRCKFWELCEPYCIPRFTLNRL